jgi:hypothetical protein
MTIGIALNRVWCGLSMMLSLRRAVQLARTDDCRWPEGLRAREPMTVPISTAGCRVW